MSYYRERLWPSPWIFGIVILVIPAALLVFLQINPVVGIATAAILYLGLTGALILTAPVIEVTATHVVAGRARLPLAVVGAVSTHRGADATLERGQRLDARAWMLIRGWIDPVVKLQVVDDDDPTPYWVVSTRHPADFAESIATAKSH